MKKIIIYTLLASSFSLGCAASFEENKILEKSSYSSVRIKNQEDRTYCRSLDDERIMWGSYAKASGLLSGSSGIGSIPIKNENYKTVIQSASVLFAAFSIGSLFAEEGKAMSWVRDCSK